MRNLPGRLVAIHQPNFFPWLGYFDKIVRADVFILMDNAQFPKTGGTWCNRVQWLIGGKAAWVTAPIFRAYHGVRRIHEIQFNNATPWRRRLVQTLETNYRRAPFYSVVAPGLIDLLNNPSDNLADYNIHAIRTIALMLGLDASKFVLGSTLNVAGNATDLLINMVHLVDGTAYLAGGGAGGYQEDEKFAAAGLELICQNFKHPVYSNNGMTSFIPGLSIIDALMQCGFEKSRSLLEPGLRI